MKKIYLVDVSGYIYRSYFALPPMSNADGQATHALYGFARSMLKLIKDFSPTHLAAVFDGPEGKKSRTDIYPDYKAHRAAAPDDLFHQIDWAADFCELLGIPQVSAPGVEADDSIGTIARQASQSGSEVYVCTSDKDLYQLVSDNIFVLNTHKDNLVIDAAKVQEIYGVRPDQIVDLLALMGDTSDNIPGVSGIGPKTAAKYLQEYGTLENLLAHAAEVPGKRGQTLIDEADIARLSHRLATLDFNVNTPADLEFFKRQDPDEGGLRGFYQKMNFTSLQQGLGKPVVEDASGNYVTVDDPAALKKLVATLEHAGEISFDTETTHLRPLLAELVGIGFAVEARSAWYVPTNGKLGRQAVISALKPLFENPKLSFYAHNSKYDLHVLANYGINVATLSFDTMLASYVINSHSRRHSLDHLALTHFEKVKTPIKDLIGSGKKEITMDKVPIRQVTSYCGEDVDYTLRLKGLFEEELKTRKLEKVFYEMEMPLLPILFEMERKGIYADVDKLHHMAKAMQVEIGRLEKEIYALAGEPFSINSPKQLSEILFVKMGIHPLKKTKTGFSTNAEVLEGLAEKVPLAGKILEYRSLEKLRSTYLEKLPDEINPKTGRIHCTFNQSVAATGRLSCQDPNLQNIPVRSPEGRKIRSAFRPKEKGRVFLSADYSQIELRLLAHLSEDPTLIAAFQKGEDIHAFTASEILNVPLDEVTKQQRHQAKAVNFGLIYGQQAFGLAREVGISMQEAARFIDAYFERFSHVKAYLNSCKEEARQTGRATTMFGRERLIPEITGRNAMQRAAAERLAINTPLQGTAADLIKLAMLKVDKEVPKEAELLLQIHDELLFELDKSAVDHIKPLIVNAMEKVITLKVPLIVDVAIGKNWEEC